jgi:hypothetical protein
MYKNANGKKNPNKYFCIWHVLKYSYLDQELIHNYSYIEQISVKGEKTKITPIKCDGIVSLYIRLSD